jgi:L-seryl-tRNA(Ser) seleniumtransferase
VINAGGTFTKLTGSLLAPEVRAAMDEVALRFYRLNEFHDACATHIAELIGVDAAMITSGATAAIALGTAACITGTDPALIEALPHVEAEVLIPAWHRDVYDRAMRLTGARLVECSSIEDARSKVSSKTAMLAFVYFHEPDGPIRAEEWAALSKETGKPALIDIAADVPPKENLSRFWQMGFVLTAVSGGKAMRGPQSAGLLLGRRDLIAAARTNGSPNDLGIGRAMKVSKEEMAGITAAVERFLKLDHEAEFREWRRRADLIAATLARLDVQVQHWVPPIANHSPHLHIRWDFSKLSLEDAIGKLRQGDPSIEVSLDSTEDLIIATWMLGPGETEIVAERLVKILTPVGFRDGTV